MKKLIKDIVVSDNEKRDYRSLHLYNRYKRAHCILKKIKTAELEIEKIKFNFALFVSVAIFILGHFPIPILFFVFGIFAIYFIVKLKKEKNKYIDLKLKFDKGVYDYVNKIFYKRILDPLSTDRILISDMNRLTEFIKKTFYRKEYSKGGKINKFKYKGRDAETHIEYFEDNKDLPCRVVFTLKPKEEKKEKNEKNNTPTEYVWYIFNNDKSGNQGLLNFPKKIAKYAEEESIFAKSGKDKDFIYFQLNKLIDHDMLGYHPYEKTNDLLLKKLNKDMSSDEDDIYKHAKLYINQMISNNSENIYKDIEDIIKNCLPEGFSKWDNEKQEQWIKENLPLPEKFSDLKEENEWKKEKFPFLNHPYDT